MVWETTEELMHRPVLLNEAVEALAIKPDGQYVDCTLGGGGHAEAVLQRLGPEGRLLGLDRDAEALARAGERLVGWARRSVLVHANFADLADVAREREFAAVDGVIMDLGMSSLQVDEAGRGFSFQQEGPLDMRMDRTTGPTAADLVNQADEGELRRMLAELGEEPQARRVAQGILEARAREPITTTLRMADIVRAAKGGRRGRIHPATQTFMALRMAVNQEKESLQKGLKAAFELVKPGGRVVVISFHSIEDRMVKHTMAEHVGRWESLAAGGSRWLGREPAMKWVAKKPITPSEDEIQDNPRARSSKLRAVERIR